MKHIVTTILAFACAFVFAFSALADTWTDSETGIKWTYMVRYTFSGGTEK